MDLKVERDFIPYQTFDLDYLTEMVKCWMSNYYEECYLRGVKKDAILIIHYNRLRQLEISIQKLMVSYSIDFNKRPLNFQFLGANITAYPTSDIEEGKVILK